MMTKGGVAWVARQAGGPDFFKENDKAPATFGGTQQTNFGFMEDEEGSYLLYYQNVSSTDHIRWRHDA